MPALEGRLPKDSDEESKITYARLDTKPAEEAFGMKYRSLETTFQDEARKLLELEKTLEGK